jgi:hypothetical protein
MNKMTSLLKGLKTLPFLYHYDTVCLPFCTGFGRSFHWIGQVRQNGTGWCLGSRNLRSHPEHCSALHRNGPPTRRQECLRYKIGIAPFLHYFCTDFRFAHGAVSPKPCRAMLGVSQERSLNCAATQDASRALKTWQSHRRSIPVFRLKTVCASRPLASDRAFDSVQVRRRRSAARVASDIPPAPIAAYTVSPKII